MDGMYSRPKLVFFQFRYDENVPEFLLMHKREHVRCLSQFFDVTVINEDCDYQKICDTYEPELTLFESGLQLPTAHRLNIRNTGGYPDVPKLGFHNADAWSETRAGILSDMDHWGIETFFSICVTAAEHTPEIARNLFVWPNFVNPDIFRDYGESKIVPVLLSGRLDPQYPWRHKVYKLIPEHYPSLICPHRGYYARSAAGQMMHGERYARSINGSWFATTCGTTAKEVLRKHLEIPGCRTCLLTEDAPALRAAGFIDMKNCVFVDEHNVIDKLAYLFENREELERITNAGYQLVHSSHTMKQRDQIFQWFNLYRNLKPDEKIIQTSPFEPLVVAKISSGVENAHIMSHGLHLELCRQADKLMWSGRYEEAELLYCKSSNYVGDMMADPSIRIAVCNLYKGEPRKALSWIVPLIRQTLARYKAVDPDPIEWAYLIVCLMCLGKLNLAARRASQFSWLRHPELDHTRMAVNILKNDVNVESLLLDTDGKYRRSIHQLPVRNFSEWIEQLCVMLKACDKDDMAERLMKASPPERVRRTLGDTHGTSGMSIRRKDCLDGQRLRWDVRLLLQERLSYRGLRWILRRLSGRIFQQLTRGFNHFLTHHTSEEKEDGLFVAISKLSREEDVRTVLVIGSESWEKTVVAHFVDVLENQNRAKVFCICNSKHGYAEVVEQIRQIKDEQRVSAFDVVFIVTLSLRDELFIRDELNNELRQARFVVLDGINGLSNRENYKRLHRDPDYVLVSYNMEVRDGYAIFKKDGLIGDAAEHREGIRPRRL